MARGRMLNNKVSASRQMNELLPDDTCRLLATWLISHLDKNGVYYGEAVVVKSFVLPRRADVSVEDVERYLLAMQDAGLIILFQARDEQWQWWPEFAGNQPGLRPERESTCYPPPPVPVPESLPPDDGKMPDECRQDDGNTPAEEKLSEGKEKVSEDVGATAPVQHDEPSDYDKIRLAWAELFPDKPQPRRNNTTLQGKVRTRMRSAHFRNHWRQALERAAQSQFLLESPWFDLAWILKNDDHYERCLSGKYDDRARSPPKPKSSTAIETVIQREGWDHA